MTNAGCKPDSTGADWFACHRGTVGCPRVHDGLTPHCIACAAGEPCKWEHDPPVLEKPAHPDLMRPGDS